MYTEYVCTYVRTLVLRTYVCTYMHMDNKYVRTYVIYPFLCMNLRGDLFSILDTYIYCRYVCTYVCMCICFVLCVCLFYGMCIMCMHVIDSISTHMYM